MLGQKEDSLALIDHLHLATLRFHLQQSPKPLSILREFEERRWSAASWSANIAPAAEDLGQVCACHDQRSRYKSQHKAKLFSHKLQ